VDVGDVDAKAAKFMIPVNKPFPTDQELSDGLLKGLYSIVPSLTL
jgi:hypothetical protein